MDNDSIEVLKKELPNCYPQKPLGENIDWGDTFVWPINPVGDSQSPEDVLDRRREEEDTYLPEEPIDREEVIDASEKIRKKLDSEPFPGGARVWSK